MSKVGSGSNYRKKKKLTIGDLYIPLTLIALAILFLPSFIIGQGKTNAYIKNAAVIKVNIVQVGSEGDNYYLKVKPVSGQDTSTLENFSKSDSDLRVEITYNVYINSYINIDAKKEYGALVTQVEEYKQEGFINKTQKLIGTRWELTDVYDSYADAIAKNPEKNFEAEATVTKTHVTKRGDNFLVLEYDGRTFTLQVTAEQFKKVQVGYKYMCSFQSVGQMLKIEKIVE